MQTKTFLLLKRLKWRNIILLLLGLSFIVYLFSQNTSPHNKNRLLTDVNTQISSKTRKDRPTLTPRLPNPNATKSKRRKHKRHHRQHRNKDHRNSTHRRRSTTQKQSYAQQNPATSPSPRYTPQTSRVGAPTTAEPSEFAR